MEEEIFDAKELYAMEHTPNGRSRRIDSINPRHRRKMMYENMHLMEGMTFTKIHQNPQLAAYNGQTDFKIVSYLERNKHDGKNEALHFFLDDYRFRDAVWDKLDKTTYAINKFDYLFTPDFSLWRDLPKTSSIKKKYFVQGSLVHIGKSAVSMSYRQQVGEVCHPSLIASTGYQ